MEVEEHDDRKVSIRSIKECSPSVGADLQGAIHLRILITIDIEK